MCGAVVVQGEFRTGALRAKGAVWLPARDGARAGWKGEATAEGMALDLVGASLPGRVLDRSAVLWVA